MTRIIKQDAHQARTVTIMDFFEDKRIVSKYTPDMLHNLSEEALDSVHNCLLAFKEHGSDDLGLERVLIYLARTGRDARAEFSPNQASIIVGNMADLLRRHVTESDEFGALAKSLGNNGKLSKKGEYELNTQAARFALAEGQRDKIGITSLILDRTTAAEVMLKYNYTPNGIGSVFVGAALAGIAANIQNNTDLVEDVCKVLAQFEKCSAAEWIAAQLRRASLFLDEKQLSAIAKVLQDKEVGEAITIFSPAQSTDILKWTAIYISEMTIAAAYEPSQVHPAMSLACNRIRELHNMVKGNDAEAILAIREELSEMFNPLLGAVRS